LRDQRRPVQMKPSWPMLWTTCIKM
jgi:hypothetical protein